LLSSNALPLAVLALSRLRRRDHRPLSVPVLERAAWTGARRVRPHAGGVRRMNLASPFSISIVAITLLAFLGLPVGHAMIAGSILYLWLARLDMGTAAQQFLNGMHVNYIMLSVPLFIPAAGPM